MSDRPPDDVTEPIDDEGPGSDPGAAYERAAEEGQVSEGDRETDEPVPGVEDVYRSGS